jgi:hypothetical protein
MGAGAEMKMDGLLPADVPAVWAAFCSGQAPALPAAPWMPFALHLSWAVVLAWLAMAASARLPLVVRRVFGGVVLGWTLLPGAWSPAFALGLVWQSPSLLTVVLCGSGLFWRFGLAPGGMPAPVQWTRLTMVWAVCGVVLGWALLLDAFALLPVALFAFGFSAASLLLALLVLGLPWVAWGGGNARPVLCLSLALLLYAALRLPTGNVWDALLDPLLWLWLQARCLWQLARHALSGRTAPPAIRA